MSISPLSTVGKRPIQPSSPASISFDDSDDNSPPSDDVKIYSWTNNHRRASGWDITKRLLTALTGIGAMFGGFYLVGRNVERRIQNKFEHINPTDLIGKIKNSHVNAIYPYSEIDKAYFNLDANDQPVLMNGSRAYGDDGVYYKIGANGLELAQTQTGNVKVKTRHDIIVNADEVRLSGGRIGAGINEIFGGIANGLGRLFGSDNAGLTSVGLSEAKLPKPPNTVVINNRGSFFSDVAGWIVAEALVEKFLGR